MRAMSTLDCRIAHLYVHPVKSCGAMAVNEAPVIDTGLEWDREWMVVDAASGRFVSQRELPRMALVQPAMRAGELVLRAPGMLALHLSLEAVESRTRATVWHDARDAWDMGALAAQWFSDFLGRPLRLVRVDPDDLAVCNPRWTGEDRAVTAFADGYPLLVCTQAALDDLAQRTGQAMDWRRFRPNLVLDGLDAHAEDFLERIEFDTPDGPLVLRPVKPCVRCSIPDVDPATGEPGHAVGDALRAYRADARMDGALTFGMNTIVTQGLGAVLRVGQHGRATIAF